MFRLLCEAVKYAAGHDTSARDAARATSYLARLNEVEAKLKLLQWMVGANIVLNFVILLKMLSAG